jgi:hypothetical protein
MAGVGVGTGVLSSLLGKLTSLLNDKYNMVKRVRKDIAFLERELRRMQILVNTLADMEHLDDLAKDWKGSMRDLSYDMEDCIDRFMVCLGNGDANRGFMKKTARRLKQLWARHGIATQIKELKARVVEESERRQRSNLDNSVASPTRTVKIDPRLPAFHEVVKGLVAMDGRRDQVTAWVMDEGVELKVVAVVGPGGLGKTTLAMEVYRKITAHFQCRASVSVSRTLDLDKLLKDVLHQIDHKAFSKCQSEQWEKEQLIREIAQILTDKRYMHGSISSSIQVTSLSIITIKIIRNRCTNWWEEFIYLYYSSHFKKHHICCMLFFQPWLFIYFHRLVMLHVQSTYLLMLKYLEYIFIFS